MSEIAGFRSPLAAALLRHAISMIVRTPSRRPEEYRENIYETNINSRRVPAPRFLISSGEIREGDMIHRRGGADADGSFSCAIRQVKGDKSIYEMFQYLARRIIPRIPNDSRDSFDPPEKVILKRLIQTSQCQSLRLHYEK